MRWFNVKKDYAFHVVKISYKWAILSRFIMPINCEIYRDKIGEIGDFLPGFFWKIVIHNYLDKITISYWRYDRRFFWKSRLIAQTWAILKTWVITSKMFLTLSYIASMSIKYGLG